MRRVWIGLGIVVGVALVIVLAGYIAIRSIDWNEYKAPLAEAVRDATGRELDLSGDLSVAIGLSPGIVVEQVSFANADWGSQLEMVTVDRLVFQLRLIPLLSGRVDVDRIELHDVDLLLETNADGVANWQFEAPAEAGEEAPPEEEGETGGSLPEIRSVLIENARILIRDLSTDSQRSIVVESLDARVDDASGLLALDLRTRVDGVPVHLDGTVTRIGELLGGAPVVLDVALEAGGTRTSIEGRIDRTQEPMSLALDVASKGDEIGDWRPLVGSAIPALGAYHLRAALAGTAEQLKIRNLDAGVGASSLSGEIDLALGGKRPRIKAKLASPLLDLADLQEAGEAGTASTEPAEPEGPAERDARVLSDDPLPLDVLASIDAKISLAVDQLRSSSLELADLSAELGLDDGRLRIDPLSFRVAGGSVKLALDVDSGREPPRIAIEGSADQLVTAELLGGSGSLEGGPFDLRLDLSGRGRSVAEIASALDGSLVLDMDDVRLKSEMAGLAVADLQSMLLGRSDVGAAKINCVLVDFAFQKGIGRPNGLVIDLESVALFGSGQIDLAQEKIALRFDRESKSVSASRALPPFTIGGTFAEPKTGIDATRLAGRVADLGAEVLTGDLLLKWESWPEGCRALLAAYEKAKTEPSQAEKAVRAGGKEALDSLKGLLRSR